MRTGEIKNALRERGFIENIDEINGRTIYTHEPKEIWKGTKYSIIPNFNLIITVTWQTVKVEWYITKKKKIKAIFNGKSLRCFNELNDMFDNFLSNNQSYMPDKYKQILYFWGWKSNASKELLKNTVV